MRAGRRGAVPPHPPLALHVALLFVANICTPQGSPSGDTRAAARGLWRNDLLQVSENRGGSSTVRVLDSGKSREDESEVKRAKASVAHHEHRTKARSAAQQTVKELSEKAGLGRVPKLKAGESTTALYQHFHDRENYAKSHQAVSKEGGEKRTVEISQKSIASAKHYNMLAKAQRDYAYSKIPNAEHEDLGESMGVSEMKMSDADKQKLTLAIDKAQEKTQKGIDALNAENQADVAREKQKMESQIAAATKTREETDRKADDLANQGPDKWKEENEKRLAVKEQKWDAIREKGTKFLRELEAKVATKTQKVNTFWMAKISEVRSQLAKFEESKKQWYMRQVSTFDQSRSLKIADAQTEYEKQSEALKNLMLQAKTNLETQTETLKEKFAAMIREAESRKAEALANLKQTKAEAIAAAKQRIQVATDTMKAEIAAADDAAKLASGKAHELLKEADNTGEALDSQKDMLKRFEEEYRAKLLEMEGKTNAKITVVKAEMAKELSSVQHSLDTTQSQAQQRMADAIAQHEAEASKQKEKEMTWQERAADNARLNCQDARDSADMKGKAAKFAAQRVSRDAQSRMVITKNHWLDAEEQARELRKKKDREATELKETTVSAAIAMAKQMYGGDTPRKDGDPPCAEAFSMDPGDLNPSKIPDETQLDDASAQYAKAYMPLVKEDEEIKKRDIERKEAHEVAMKKTWTWAHNHALKVAKEANVKADKECAESHKFFAEVKTTAKSQLGDINDKKAEVARQAKADAQQWAINRTQVLITQKQNITTSMESQISSIKKEIEDEKHAYQEDNKGQIADTKQKIAKYGMESQSLRAQGKINLKLAKEERENRVKEAEKLQTVARTSAEKMEESAEGRADAQKLSVESDADREINGFKMELSSAVENLKENFASHDGAGKLKLQEVQILKDKNAVEAKLDQSYQTQLAEAKGERDSMIKTERADTKRKVSVYQEDQKKEVVKYNERVSKAILKEKQEEEKIDRLRKEENERAGKTKKDFMTNIESKKLKMKQDAKEKEKADIAAAKTAYEAYVDKDLEATKKKIHDVKEQVLESVQPS